MSGNQILAPYKAESIINNIIQVIKANDISRLSKPAYKFITLHMGFIAHYNVDGFKAKYHDVANFCQKLQTSEKSTDPGYNIRWAGKKETDPEFIRMYGQAYCHSVAEGIRGIVKAAVMFPKINKVAAESCKSANWEQIGVLGVDSGYLTLADNLDEPEVRHFATTLKNANWPSFLQLNYQKGHAGAGIVVETGSGDGVYPVYARYKVFPFVGRRVAEIRVIFHPHPILDD